ncbi:trypsin [Dictyocaulus viviparus]|uniref:Trypsin n=1 Tax=Dictyocaulus viviparus TaxID=29172 RepID=A0A0D8XF18_DICVI|nr:trypsin [Dictyocaulus viviparus]
MNEALLELALRVKSAHTITEPYGFVKKYGCSAVQISKRHILTAAHCVVQASPILTKLCDEGRSSTAKYTVLNPSDFTLFIGSGCTNPDRCLHPKRYYSVKKVFVYTFYDACNLINDIAVLEISPNILPSDGYPVCMPRQDDLLENTLTAVGFGIDPTTRRRQREILSDLRSVNLTRSTPDIPKTIKTVDNKKSICLVSYMKSDSGGPLTQNKDDANYTAVGIASARFPACSQPTRVRSSYFTDVRKFLNWICNKTGMSTVPL